MQEIRHGFYTPYFYWYFPLLIAEDEGIFKKESLNFSVRDIVKGGQPEDKAHWYLGAFEQKVRNFYFCCTWQGVYSVSTTSRGKVVAAAPSTLIKTFGIYTSASSPVKSVFDLGEKGRRVGVNKNADAHYVTLKNMLQFLPESKIELAHIGGVEQCLRAVLDGKVEAATLAGPYAEFAEHVGMRKVMGLSRDEPSLVVMDDPLDKETVIKFLKVMNVAISMLRENPEKYRDLYYKEFEVVVQNLYPELVPKLEGFKEKMTVPVWAQVRPLSVEEFKEVKDFMIATGLALGKGEYEQLVDPEIAMLAA